MNHRGGRARPPSLCRSGPGDAGAPASLVAPRLLRTRGVAWVTPTSPDSFGWRDPFLFFFFFFFRERSSPDTQEDLEDSSRDQFLFLIMEVNLIEFTRRWGWDIRGIYF